MIDRERAVKQAFEFVQNVCKGQYCTCSMIVTPPLPSNKLSRTEIKKIYHSPLGKTFDHLPSIEECMEDVILLFEQFQKNLEVKK
jgi:hypothetical protein